MKKIKRFYDPIHRFIQVDALESALIATTPFQRLRYIHQLGVTFFVYPSSTHRRFEHSLGVMELATQMYDEISRENPLELSGEACEYWRRILRLGALCHDLGHLPLSHAAERYILGEEGHERWTEALINSPFLSPIWERFAQTCAKKSRKEKIREDIAKISLGEGKFRDLHPQSPPFSPWEKIVSSLISGDCFGADRIDYLLRDSRCTGLAYGSFDYHQLITTLRVIPSPGGEKTHAIGIDENGMESCEALLFARHYMHKRLYQHPSVKAHSFHLARFMRALYPNLGENLDDYIEKTDNEVLSTLNLAAHSPSHPGHFDAKCLYSSALRFRAIPLPSHWTEEDLRRLQSALNIPKGEISWETPKEGHEERKICSLPVLRRDGSIDMWEEISDISMRTEEKIWIFTPPQHELAIFKQIKEMKKRNTSAERASWII